MFAAATIGRLAARVWKASIPLAQAIAKPMIGDEIFRRKRWNRQLSTPEGRG